MASLRRLYGKDKPTIPESVIRAMSDKELDFMAKWNGPDMHTPSELAVHEDLLADLAVYLGPMSASSRTALYTAQADRKSGVTLRVGNPEQALWKTGGTTYYDKDFMYLAHGSGEVKIIPNTIVPDPEAKKRNALVPMVVLMSSILKLKQGKLDLLHDPATYTKRWISQGAPFRPFRMLEVLDKFQKAVDKTPAWRAAKEAESTLTNERLVDFIYSCLYDMPEVTYYYLHTFVVFEFLCVFEPTDKVEKASARFSLLRKKRGNKLLVPETAYTIVDKKDISSDTARQILKMGYPCVALFRGGIVPNIKVAPEADMASAVAAKAQSIATRGSDKSALSFLCRNGSYSGLATEEVRTLQRCVSMVCGVIETGIKMIDIEISSIGHVPVICTSLTAHFPHADWLLCMTNEMSMKCSSSYAHRIATDRRPGSHLVRYMPYQMKSHSLTKKDGGDELIAVSLKNYNLDSTKWKPHEQYSGYTVYTTVFGYYPWSPAMKGTTESETTEASSSSSSVSRSYIDRIYPPRPHYVYKFAQTESFCGIISTIKDFALWGQEFHMEMQMTPSGKKPLITFTKKPLPLDRVHTETDWYRKVINSNAIMEAYWMVASPKFSPISNVLRIPKHGVTISYDTLGEVEITDQSGYVEAPETVSDETEGYDQGMIGQGEYDYDAEYDSAEHDGESQEESDPDDEDEDYEDDEEDEVITPAPVVAPAKKVKPVKAYRGPVKKDEDDTDKDETPEEEKEHPTKKRGHEKRHLTAEKKGEKKEKAERQEELSAKEM